MPVAFALMPMNVINCDLDVCFRGCRVVVNDRKISWDDFIVCLDDLIVVVGRVRRAVLSVDVFLLFVCVWCLFPPPVSRAPFLFAMISQVSPDDGFEEIVGVSDTFIPSANVWVGEYPYLDKVGMFLFLTSYGWRELLFLKEVFCDDHGVMYELDAYSGGLTRAQQQQQQQ